MSYSFLFIADDAGKHQPYAQKTEQVNNDQCNVVQQNAVQ